MFNDQFMRVVCMRVNALVCMCVGTLVMHFFPSCCRAETERGLNRKHIIEGNKSIASPPLCPSHHPITQSPRCTPVISLFYLFSCPLFLAVCVFSLLFDFSQHVHPAEFERCISQWYIKPRQMFCLFGCNTFTGVFFRNCCIIVYYKL